MAVVHIEHPPGCGCDYCSQVKVIRKEFRIHKSKIEPIRNELRFMLIEMCAIGVLQRAKSHYEGETCVISMWPCTDQDALTGEDLFKLSLEGIDFPGELISALIPKTTMEANS